MRRSLCTIVLVAGFSTLAAGQMRRSGVPNSFNTPLQDVGPDRIDRLAQWLTAVDRHEPGVDDDTAIEVGGWNNTQLRGLWIDVHVLSQLMRNVRMSRFMVRAENQRNVTEVVYTAEGLRKLRVFACAAAGILDRPDCVAIKAAVGAGDDLIRVAQHARDGRSRTGDDNYVMRRAALLHADIAMLQPRSAVEPFASPSGKPLVGPQTWRVDISDGRGLDVGLSA